MMIKLSTAEKEFLVWLVLRSALSPKRLVHEFVEYVYLICADKFHLCEEKFKNLLESEAISLLDGIAKNKIQIENEKKFANYLQTRVNRALRNAYAQNLITSVIYISELANENQGISEDENKKNENKKEDKSKQVKKEKTIRKAHVLFRLQGFYPGCLAYLNSKPKQLDLFKPDNPNNKPDLHPEN